MSPHRACKILGQHQADASGPASDDVCAASVEHPVVGTGRLRDRERDIGRQPACASAECDQRSARRCRQFLQEQWSQPRTRIEVAIDDACRDAFEFEPDDIGKRGNGGAGCQSAAFLQHVERLVGEDEEGHFAGCFLERFLQRLRQVK